MFQPTRQETLRLYKHLIRYGSQLQLTDKSYFLGRIRREFRENREIQEPKQIEFCFRRGEALLTKGRVL
ncbi:uncharacterized protein LOC119681055 [Teleopsis dalmanni]|uniref:uncharacterized protein LOC119681055 n=1 Tax=Teleopsis dalmanni TaxID=139649 RepID=UPI0018CEA51A|nr:uncharacterized protein LOC119681055 [Teleopsis dalmanni]